MPDKKPAKKKGKPSHWDMGAEDLSKKRKPSHWDMGAQDLSKKPARKKK